MDYEKQLIVQDTFVIHQNHRCIIPVYPIHSSAAGYSLEGFSILILYKRPCIEMVERFGGPVICELISAAPPPVASTRS